MLLSKPGMCRQLGCDRLNTVALALQQFANCTHGTGLGSWWQPWGLQPRQEHASQTDTAGSLASLYWTHSFSFSPPHDQPKRKKVHNQGEKKHNNKLPSKGRGGGGGGRGGLNNDNHHHFIHYHCHFGKLTDLSNCILQNLTKSLPTQSSNTHTVFSAFQVPGSLQHKGSYFTPEKVYQVFHSWVKAEAAISGRPDRSQPAACLSAQWPAIAEGTETSGEHRGNISSP